jgi:hypothetical protein
MIALALAQAVIALHGHAMVALGWFTGLVVFVGVLVVPDHDLLLRVELALVIASAASLVLFAVVLRRLVRRGVRPTEDSLFEAFEELPLDS